MLDENNVLKNKPERDDLNFAKKVVKNLTEDVLVTLSAAKHSMLDS